MTLHIDPTYWPVWRDPFTLQFGVDEPRAVLTNVTHNDERFVSLLTRGMSVGTLEHFAAAAGIEPERARELLQGLRAVLLSDSTPRPPQSERAVPHPVDLRWPAEAHQESASKDLLASLLYTVGFEKLSTRSRVAGPNTFPLGLVIADYVALPHHFQPWQSNDQPHTALVFSDHSVRWGPIVPLPAGGCLLCPELLHRERDSAWPAIATQAHRLRAPTHTPEIEALAFAGLAADLGAWRRATHTKARRRKAGTHDHTRSKQTPTAQHPLAGRMAVLSATTRRVSYYPAVRYRGCDCQDTLQTQEQIPE
ncbi:hypothetical protein [Lysinibacter cavernae]|uniref:Uncharacterized protein n=1 Tax=Lysinibacter cavernae TaxID=1640652 RepID=A0A7X5QYN2_9MICO|nr:hypothetical protein [Lysinibacter cavernae]NIH52361.1 hypothetical protein [Lysinibacter cavernae]